MARADSVTIRVDRTRATQRLNKLLTKIGEAGEATANEMGRIGLEKEKRLAPYWSGGTFRAIRLVEGKGPRVVLLASNVVHDGHNRRHGKFDLTRWMHESNGILHGRKHIKSGDPRFVYTTRDFLRAIGAKVGREQFSLKISGV